MCGRFTLVAIPEDIQDAFDMAVDPSQVAPRYNIAPTQDVLSVVQRQEGRRAEMFRWGLVPSWANDAKIGNKMINARAETVFEKPGFRSASRRRRCLVVADGFYEWHRTPKERQPYRFGLKDWQPFGLAGLWESWRSPQGDHVRSCTIITTSSNELVGRVHSRMPVMLSAEGQGLWLDENKDVADLRELLVPYDAGEMDTYRVSSLVNSPSNDMPDVIARAD